MDPELSNTNITLGFAPGTALYNGAWLGVLAASASLVAKVAETQAATKPMVVSSRRHRARLAVAGVETSAWRVAFMLSSL
ncbi:hypothetical protein D3C86_1062620 [compost metagenome]